MKNIFSPQLTALATGTSALCLMGSVASADIVHLDDVIITGSLCVGFDCVNGESFGFDTVRLKENNVRLHFQDTSTSASFPTNDWRIIANGSANGGGNFFAIQDVDAGRNVFKVEAGAPVNALYVENDGDVGLGTSNPVVNLHVVDGNTPTLRLEQDGSNGFAPQTWDVAGNEANFFIRDATNGSTLPIRLRPGAPSSSIDIAADGDVGIGTASPDADLEVVSSSILNPLIQAHSTGAFGVVLPIAVIKNDNAVTAQRHMLSLENNGKPFLSLIDTSVAVGDNLGRQWNMSNTGGEFRVTTAPGGLSDKELALDGDGNLTISGSITTNGSCSIGCDRVFDVDYEMPSIKQHASLMWTNQHLPAVGPTAEEGPMNLSEKVGGMLNELEKAHIYIEQLHNRLAVLENMQKI